MRAEPGVYAVSDLHVSYAKNRELAERIEPRHPGDWLVVAGDVGERLADIATVLARFAERFARVIWAPGNHELWSRSDTEIRGVARYEQLISIARRLGVSTPEDDYPLWTGTGGPVAIAPLMLLYDYSFGPAGTTRDEAVRAALAAGIRANDERYLHPDPYSGMPEWCAARVESTRRRLDAVTTPLVLVNHWPLLPGPTRAMRYQVFTPWCGTVRSADWHTRYDVRAVVYGHLHMPRTSHYDGVRFVDVSLGYPREWRRFGLRDDLARLVL